jgi:hypothetical protein
MSSRRIKRRLLSGLGLFALSLVLFGRRAEPATASSGQQKAALGVDVDFYTGPISRDVWRQMKQAGIRFVVAQAWGGRSRNEFAVSQLRAARSIGEMKEAAYVLLNYDDKVCPSFSQPVREPSGKCSGDPVTQTEPGGRWQVRQGLLALGSELKHVAFVAIDVEWFLNSDPPGDAAAQSRRRQYIVDAIDEVRSWRKKPVIYTRNVDGHWVHITGCDAASLEPGCRTLSSAIHNSVKPVPLWDVQLGGPDLSDFRAYGEWNKRAGRQYKLDRSLFGLPPERTVDLDIFEASLFQ